jgi:hypothetical protein
MHKNAMKYNETLSKWCKNKHGASKIIDTLETYHRVTHGYRGRGCIRLQLRLCTVAVPMAMVEDQRGGVSPSSGDASEP